MYENYKATKKDLELIEEGIKTVWRTVLNFIFSKKNFLKNIAIISYDSSYIYLWTMMYFPHLKRLHCGLSGYYAYKINHNTKLKDEWQLSWRAGSPDESLNKLLPEKLNDSSF
ncbi:hypothetical protein HYW87_04695, partial [Candidatus Roizmanbacteria bacterium]|nr:hypothetical protein [Candidatus Roizmanbacteria bacterium]